MPDSVSAIVRDTTNNFPDTMVREELHELLLHLPSRRRVFRYYKDRYAPLLLGYAFGAGASVREIKQSRFAQLLERPVMKRTVALLPDGFLTPAIVEAGAPYSDIPYVITFGQWGYDTTRRHLDYYQTTRPGRNLVLQLNFSGEHDTLYRRLFPFTDWRSFTVSGHPVSTEGRTTLAWSRIDLDRRTGEALIEEIQNDWIRGALRRHAWYRERFLLHQAAGDLDLEEPWVARGWALAEYMAGVLEPHLAIWAEATLAATICVLREELGIRTIYYHTHRSGQRLKRIRTGAPPRSLYSTLPRSFCFRATRDIPEFLRRDDRWMRRNAVRIDSIRFHRLEL